MTTETVYYEPEHDINTARTIFDVLAARGYSLDSDGSTLRYSPILKTMVLQLPPTYSIEIIDGQIQLCTVDGETNLDSVETFESAADYATALADALDAQREAS